MLPEGSRNPGNEEEEENTSIYPTTSEKAQIRYTGPNRLHPMLVCSLGFKFATRQQLMLNTGTMASNAMARAPGAYSEPSLKSGALMLLRQDNGWARGAKGAVSMSLSSSPHLHKELASSNPRFGIVW